LSQREIVASTMDSPSGGTLMEIMRTRVMEFCRCGAATRGLPLLAASI
jgi:hypothetical protein